tara:strand:+ start:27288 stop:28163 length:876 start_codon:yes stop_codon:yes gene_type:complete
MISIILPSYNEAKSIESYISKLKDSLKDCDYKYEILIVDDGSTDNTQEIVKNLDITCIKHNINLGYGSALKTGIKNSKFETILISDLDESYPTTHVPEIIKKYFDSKKDNNTGFDMIVGERSGKYYNETVHKTIFRKILKFIVEWTTGTKINDINSGFRIFSKSTIIKFFPHLSNAFSFSTSSTLAYLLSNKIVTYIPIEYLKREGKSHVKLFRDSLRTLQYILQAILYYNPLKVFLLFTFLFISISFIFLLFYWYLNSKIIIFLSLIFLSSSILSFLIGLIATAISEQKK